MNPFLLATVLDCGCEILRSGWTWPPPESKLVTIEDRRHDDVD